MKDWVGEVRMGGNEMKAAVLDIYSEKLYCKRCQDQVDRAASSKSFWFWFGLC